MKKTWKESASLILAARHGKKYIEAQSVGNYNYNLLCLKRNPNSKFMPNTYVFPGGIVHPSDTNPKWHKLFSTFGFDNSSFVSLFPNTSHPRPNIFQSSTKELPREISLRITAIRETFEESGILICKQSRESNTFTDWAHHFQIFKDDLSTWRTKVHNDATEFYTLCKNFKCYPDLWSLHEWSNWLTPTYFLGRRYDTIFFLACMPSVPYASQENIEVVDLKWDVPGNYVISVPELLLPPPQQYEMARIAKFENIDNLFNFAVDRSKLGVQLYLPVKVSLKDGKVHVLPGDSMYPKKINLSKKQVIDRTDITISEFRDISPIQNRMEMFNLEVKEINVCNLGDTLDGHLTPIQLKNIRVSPEKKNE